MARSALSLFHLEQAWGQLLVSGEIRPKFHTPACDARLLRTTVGPLSDVPKLASSKQWLLRQAQAEYGAIGSDSLRN